ncbi:hypothetical protein Droror1_Dr00023223 [Drosera rotundifolia]
MQDDNRKMKVKKGSLVVLVGLENDHDDDVKKFVIPISYIHHPLFSRLLDRARELYGYNTDGPLRLPCSAEDFTDLQWRIEKDCGRLQNHHHLGHYHYHALPFHTS